MKTIVYLAVFTIFSAVFAENCDKLGILVYEDLGCTAVKKDGACPTEYSCNNFDLRNKDKCYFRGKGYVEEEEVPVNITGQPCSPCTCFKHDGRAQFICAMLDCFVPPLPANCHKKASFDKCCYDEQVCAPFETCEVNGKKYREGEKFHPDNTCLECICQKGFKLEEPFCRRKGCATELWYHQQVQDKCAPIYVKRSDDVVCCPDSWICPDGTEKIADSDGGCYFGNTTVGKGQIIKKPKFVGTFGESFSQIVCECVVPPLLSCKAQ